MTTKHTQGPWFYAFEGGTAAFIAESDGTTVFEISTAENTTAHSGLAANVRLIAAAPDLLAALEVVIANPSNFNFEIIRSAIAKAKGE